jgi:hypothetical protein
MGKKYTFTCACGHVTEELAFGADFFLPARSEYLFLLPGGWWTIDLDGKVHYESGEHPWPEELSKRFFGNAAKSFARKILKGEDFLYCPDCGEDLVVKKSRVI